MSPLPPENGIDRLTAPAAPMGRMASLRTKIHSIRKGKVLFFGIGNRMRADDGAGPLLVETVGRHRGLVCIDGGVAPENYLEKIVKAAPDTVFVIDAIGFDGRAGEIRIFRSDEISGGGLSTHALSLAMVCEYLKNRMEQVAIAVIGIQPQTISLGKKMSAAVEKTVNKLAEKIIEEFR
jgi:hydrogenase maturation protease HycI